MAGVGFGGFFVGDPSPNPFQDIIPASGAMVGDNGQAVIDDPVISANSFGDPDWDPPGGNGILNPVSATTNHTQQGYMENPVSKQLKYAESYGASKLTQLRYIEEEIRDLLLTRKKLLTELKAERDEIDKRLNVSDTVTTALDEMFPDHLAKEIETGVIDE